MIIKQNPRKITLNKINQEKMTQNYIINHKLYKI